MFNPDKMRDASDAQAAPITAAVTAVLTAVFAANPPIRIISPARGRRLVMLKRYLPVRVFDAILRKRFQLDDRSSLEAKA
jgi:hypothetical protein